MKRVAAGLLLSLLAARAVANGLLLGTGGSTAAPATCSISLDFTVAGGSLPAGVTMTGAANATHYASTGIVTTSGTDVARFDYNPTSLALRGLLVEPAKTNALVHGRPDGWAATALNTLAAVTDPTGGTNAQRYSETVTNTEHHLSLNIASWPVSSQAVTFSFYVRNNSGARFLTANFANSSSFTGFVQEGVNPTSGVKDFGPTAGGNWSAATGGTVQTINISGNVWFRVSFGATVAAAAALQPDMVWTTDAPGSVFSYAGDGTSGFQLFGFQASKDSEKTLADSFIDTGGSATAVSTTADTVSFSNPACTQLLFTFDDNSTQLITGITPGTYTIPTNLNRPWIKTIIGVPSACSQATAFLAAIPAQSANYTNAFANFICGRVTSGVWAKLDAFYFLKAHESATALINAVQPGTFNATVTGSPTFTADVGYTGVASTSAYLDTGINGASSPGIKFTQNSASLCGSISVGPKTVTQSLIGQGSTPTGYIEPYFTDTNTYWRINSGSDKVLAAPSSLLGSWIATRVDSTHGTLYQNGSSISTDAGASITPASTNFRILIGGADPSSATLTTACVGGALTGADVTDLSTAISTFQSSVP